MSSSKTKSHKRILIAEDEAPIARALELKLSHVGYGVARAQDGQEAIDAMDRGEKYDLILLDLMMPQKNGFEVLEWMKDKKITTSVMVLTNLSQQEDEQRVRELGAVDFCVKSNVPIAEIVDRIERFFAS